MILCCNSSTGPVTPFLWLTTYRCNRYSSMYSIRSKRNQKVKLNERKTRIHLASPPYLLAVWHSWQVVLVRIHQSQVLPGVTARQKIDLKRTTERIIAAHWHTLSLLMTRVTDAISIQMFFNHFY